MSEFAGENPPRADAVPQPAQGDGALAGDPFADDWFGEGSAFDSGEGLAAALMALAGAGQAPTGAAAARAQTDWNEDDVAPVDDFESVARPAPAVAASSGPPPEFQVAAMPSFGAAASLRQPGPTPTRWSQRLGDADRAQRTGWAIRQSVQILKTTEDIIRRLREDAVEASWQAAGVAIAQADVLRSQRPSRNAASSRD